MIGSGCKNLIKIKSLKERQAPGGLYAIEGVWEHSNHCNVPKKASYQRPAAALMSKMKERARIGM